MSKRAICSTAAVAFILGLIMGASAPRSLAEPRLIEEKEIAGWTLRIIADEPSGYGVCSIDTTGRDLFMFGVMVERPTRRRYLTLSSLADDAPFQNGAAYSVTYSVDDRQPMKVGATGSGNHTVLIPLDDALAESLRRGRQIAFHALEGGVATFNLSGSARAFAALQDCVTRHLGYEMETPAPLTPVGSGAGASAATGNPFSSAGAVGDSNLNSTVSLAQRLETAVATAESRTAEARLIGGAILEEAHLLGDAEIVDDQSDDRIYGYDVTWLLPSAQIAFRVVKDIAPTSADAMLDNMAEALQEACSNRALVTRPERPAPEILGRLHVSCRGAPPALFALFSRPRGGMYLMAIKGGLGPDGLSASQRYDGQISDAWINKKSR